MNSESTSKVTRAIRAADERQQRYPWLAVPVAVWKKFGDDNAGNLAALIAYYGFVSIFPLLLVLVIGLGLIGTTVLSGIAAGAGSVLTGAGATIAAVVVSLVLNIGLFWLAFRLGTAAEIGWRRLRFGAIIGGVIWQVLQTVGSYFVSHQLAHASPSYGTFAVVLGLIAWLYLEAELTLYAVEINVVLTYRLWPRSIAPPPYNEQNRRAFELYAQAQQRKGMDIMVEMGGEGDREKTSG
jgi:membrane protein